MPDAPCNAGANWDAGAGGGNAEGGGTLTANGTTVRPDLYSSRLLPP